MPQPSTSLLKSRYVKFKQRGLSICFAISLAALFIATLYCQWHEPVNLTLLKLLSEI